MLYRRLCRHAAVRAASSSAATAEPRARCWRRSFPRRSRPAAGRSSTPTSPPRPRSASSSASTSRRRRADFGQPQPASVQRPQALRSGRPRPLAGSRAERVLEAYRASTATWATARPSGPGSRFEGHTSAHLRQILATVDVDAIRAAAVPRAARQQCRRGQHPRPRAARSARLRQ